MDFEQKLDETRATLAALHGLRDKVDAAAGRIVATLENGGTLLICGNGGSASQAAHLATELTGRYKEDRPSLPAIALNADGSLLSCIANDYGWEDVFSRQITGLARSVDLVVCLSTSGKSPNILRALETCRERELTSLALLGRNGGDAKGLATLEIIVPTNSTASIQEAHLVLLHYFCEQIERRFAGGNA